MKLKWQILELRLKGYTYTQIIKELKCTRSTVSYHVNKAEGEGNKSIIRMNLRHKNRKRNMKAEGIILKGGSCERCGYNKCQAALQFHHLDPKEKVSAPSYLKSRSAFLKEIKKCILLCANCHAEEHFNESGQLTQSD